MVNLYSASLRKHASHASNALSSLTRAAGRLATTCSLSACRHRLAQQPGQAAPVSCTKVPAFRSPYNGLLGPTHLTDPGRMADELALLVDS